MPKTADILYTILLHTLRAHCIFPITHNVRYQPVFHTLYFMLHCTHVLHNAVKITVIEMVEILDGRVGIAFS